MGIKFSNLATTTLASGITNSATTITVADGSVFPALGSGDFFFASIDTPPNAPEIVKVTAISSNTLTVVRGQDGTTATSHNSSETIALRVVAAALEDLRDNSGTSVIAGSNLSFSGDTLNLDTNLTGLGTISSGAITSSGVITTSANSAAAGVNIKRANAGSGGAKGFLAFRDENDKATASIFSIASGGDNNGDLRLATSSSENETDPYSLTTALTLDTSQNATFAGTISSGAITSSGRIDITTDNSISEPYAALGITSTTTSAGLFLHGSGGSKWEVQSISTGDLIFYDRTSGAYRARIMANGNFKIETGNLQMSGTTVIDSSRNLTNIGTISSGAITSSDKISASSDLETATRLKFTNSIANGWSAPIIFRESSHLALSDYSGVKLGGYNGTSYGPRFHVGGNGNVNILEGSLMMAGTTVIDSSRNLSNIGTLNGGTPFTTANDGSGSGLDADLLDGQQGSYYYSSANVPPKIKAGGNGPNAENLNTVANSVSVGQFEYRGFNSSSSNAPPVSDNANGVITVGQHSGNYNAQLAFSSNGHMYWRDNPSTSFGSWRKVWDSGNDGTGSGLDADLLDGLHASSLVRSDTDDSFTGNNLLFPTLSLNIANNNTAGTGNTYFRGNSTHFVFGLTSGNTLYMNYGNSAGSFRTEGTITHNSSLVGTKPWGNSNDGSGSGLDADTVDGVQASSLVRSDAADTMSGTYTFSGGHGAINITNSSILSSASSNWTGDPGGSGKIQYHSNRWYIVGDSSSNRIVQFRRNNADKSYIDNNGALIGGGNWYSGNDGSGSGLDADLLDGQHGSYYAQFDHFRSTGNSNYTSTTTSALASEAFSDGAMKSYLTSHKTGWSYAGNGDLTDAGRLTELAGTSWLWWTDNSSDSSTGYYTALCIAPNTGGSAGKMFVYNNQGSSYAPGWREIWTSTSDGSGSGLDADLLDGYHASTTRNAANTIPIRDGNGYLHLGWINTTSGATSSTINRIYASNDGYIRYVTPATFRDQIISGQTINEIYNNGWYRSYGSKGWYNQTYGGGIYMLDTTWVRVYNNKRFYVQNEIAATGNITAYYSDERLKTKTGSIENALQKVQSLEGFTYVENDLAKSVGYSNDKQQVGVSAQQVQSVLPEAVSLAPFDYETNEETGEITSKSGEEYLTVDYSRLVPLLIESIKELKTEVDDLKEQLRTK